MLSISSYRKQVRFLNAAGMWSVDSSGKEFSRNLTCHQNKERRSERTENVSANQEVALSDSWCPNRRLQFDPINGCHVNEYFPLEPMGWLHFWQCSLGLLLTLPDPHFPGIGCGKEKSGNYLRTWKTVLRTQLILNWTTSNRSSWGIIFSLRDKRSESSLYQKDSRINPTRGWEFFLFSFLEPEIEGQFSAFLLSPLNKISQRPASSLWGTNEIA